MFYRLTDDHLRTLLAGFEDSAEEGYRIAEGELIPILEARDEEIARLRGLNEKLMDSVEPLEEAIRTLEQELEASE